MHSTPGGSGEGRELLLRGRARELAFQGATDAGARRAAASEAAEAYDQALQLLAVPGARWPCDETRLDVQVRRGEALLVAGRPAEALAAFEAAQADDPTSLRAVAGAAEARLDAGRALEALRQIEPVLGSDPDPWLIASEAARELGAAAESLMLRRCAAERVGAGLLAPHRRRRFAELLGPAAAPSHPGARSRSARATAGGAEPFAVTVVSPPRYVHAAAFHEVAETLVHALRELGYEAELGSDPGAPGRRHVVLGAHLLPHAGQRLREGAILYNLEQVQRGSPWLTPTLLDLYRNFPLWDYSQVNADALERMGVPRPTVVPVGWMPQLTRIPPGEEDIDVLFYGSINARRRAVLAELEGRGVRVHAAFGVYGAARDRLVARSRIVLNVHHYEAKVFEIVRVSYLLANRRVVVSERGRDPREEAPFESSVAFAPYGGLVSRCLDLLADPEERARRAALGLDAMVARPQTTFLRAALSAHAARPPAVH